MAVDLKNLIDIDLLAYFKTKLDLLFANKVDKENGKGLSTNDYTAEEKAKLANIAAGAQVNVLEGVQANGTTVTPVNKIANITIPTNTSDLTNDSGFITAADVPDGATASTSTPLMDGTAAVGTSTAFARGDHVHPSDTSKVDKVNGKGLSTNDYTTAEQTKLSGIEEGAEVNEISVIKVNNTEQTISNKTVNITVPTAGSSSNVNGYVVYSTYTSALNEKADANNVYTKNEIDQKLIGAMNYKGTKASTAALPSSDNVQGDVWHVTADGSEWAWNGTAWEELGTAVDLSGYVEESEISLATNAQIDAIFE